MEICIDAKEGEYSTGSCHSHLEPLYSNTDFKPREDEFIECMNEMIEFLPSPKVDVIQCT